MSECDHEDYVILDGDDATLLIQCEDCMQVGSIPREMDREL